jgi:hypothetical protein
MKQMAGDPMPGFDFDEFRFLPPTNFRDFVTPRMKLAPGGRGEEATNNPLDRFQKLLFFFRVGN